jgi:hypothetical protein
VPSGVMRSWEAAAGSLGTGTSSEVAATGRGDEGPASPKTPSATLVVVAVVVDATASAGWGRNASWPSLVGDGVSTTR